MHVERSRRFDRPPSVVFRFIAHDHVRNHPRWDPQMELWPISDGPIGLGTILGRRQSRGAVPSEGTMEVVEFEPDRVLGWLVRDGPFVFDSRSTFEPTDDGGTLVTISVEMPDEVTAFDPAFLERSLRNMQELIERET